MDSPKNGKVLRIHAARRANERLGVKLTERRLLWLGEQIQRGKMEFVGRVSRRRTLWRTKLDGVEAVLAYDKVRHTVATITPSDGFARSPHRKKLQQVQKRQTQRKRRRSKKRATRETGYLARSNKAYLAIHRNRVSQLNEKDSNEAMCQW